MCVCVCVCVCVGACVGAFVCVRVCTCTINNVRSNSFCDIRRAIACKTNVKYETQKAKQ